MSTSKPAMAILSAGVAATLSLTAPAGTAAAIPPHAEAIAPILAVFPDVDHGLAGFLNITRADWCAWEAGGFVGEPPLLVPLSPAWEHVTGTGQISGVARDDLHMELWPLDEDVQFEGACLDTDDATEPFAVGEADVRASDKDPYGTSDGNGVDYLGDMTMNAALQGTDGHEYGYHVHVIELSDANGVLRLGDAAHFTLTMRH